MTDKEKHILQIIFMGKGLSPAGAHHLINALETKGISYDKLLVSLPRLNNIIYYFQEKNYSALTINGILELSIANDVTADKIIQMTETFFHHHYSFRETEKIERICPKIIRENSLATLDKKLTLYNDAEVKEDILENPRRIEKSLNITYSRFAMLSDRNLSVKRGALFMSELQFKDNFGYWSKDLLEKFPIKGTKYYVKK